MSYSGKQEPFISEPADLHSALRGSGSAAAWRSRPDCEEEEEEGKVLHAVSSRKAQSRLQSAGSS